MNRTRILAAVFAVPFAMPAFADPTVPPLLPEAVLANTPLGTWQLRITTFDCVSLKPNPPFESLLSFTVEGNETETTNNPMLQPGQRSTGFGTWGFTGPRAVALTTKAYILFSSPAGPIRQGSQVIHHAIRLTDDHSLTDTATIAYYDADGRQTLAGCAVAAGQRL